MKLHLILIILLGLGSALSAQDIPEYCRAICSTTTSSTSTTTTTTSSTTTSSTTTSSTTTSSTTTSSTTTSSTTSSTTTSSTTTSSTTTSSTTTSSTTTSSTTTSSTTTSSTTSSTTTSSTTSSSTTTSSTTSSSTTTSSTTTSSTTTSSTTTSSTTSSTTTTPEFTTTINPPFDCGTYSLATDETYKVKTPNYPNNYDRNDKCEWELTCESTNAIIGITCNDFEMPVKGNCKKTSYLKVTDSTGTDEYYCGDTGPDQEMADNYLGLTLKTIGSKTTYKGFICSVTCTVPPLSCGSHTISPGEEYTIESPNYPLDYGKKDTCEWEITCDAKLGIIGISCDDFELEDTSNCKKKDFLRLTDLDGTEDYYCGATGPDRDSTDNYLELKFKENGNKVQAKGFTCSVACTLQTTVTPPTTTPVPPLDCGEYTLSPGKSRTVDSPNYPSKYGKNKKCEWKFTCDDSTATIGVSCSDFNTEEEDDCEDGDYLQVIDSTGTLGYYCGTTGPSLDSDDNYLELYFKSDKNNARDTGFRCSVLCNSPARDPGQTTTPSSGLTKQDPDQTTTPSNGLTKQDPDQTTTPSGGWSGQCSNTIIAYAGMTEYWVSPNYDGTTHYPKGEYCCSLNITIPDTYDMFMVNMEMHSPSKIHETSQCVHDHIDYHSADGHTSTLCGDLGTQTWTEIASYNTPRYFSFTWCSTEADGATDIGFKMEITGKDLMG